jgi:hypothetical protein
MKLSPETITILKNFSVINQSIIFKSGSVLKTISPQKTVMAISSVSDIFPRDAGIYNLSQFLATLGLYENPELDFGDKSVTITGGGAASIVSYADASMIIAPPDKEVNLPGVDVKVEIKADQFKNVMTASGVLGLPEIAFVGESGICYLKAIDSSNPSANSHKIRVGETADEFTLIIKTENMNILSGDYTVELSSKGISKFTGKLATYFIAIESKSTYNKV